MAFNLQSQLLGYVLGNVCDSYILARQGYHWYKSPEHCGFYTGVISTYLFGLITLPDLSFKYMDQSCVPDYQQLVLQRYEVEPALRFGLLRAVSDIFRGTSVFHNLVHQCLLFAV